MRVTLRHRTFETASVSLSPLFFRVGILEPIGNVPTYQAALFTLYQRARIRGVKMTVTVINTGAEPIELVANALPYNWLSISPTLAEIIDKPGSVRRLVSGVGGMDRATLTITRTSAQVLGSHAYLADYDFDQVQALSTTPIATDEPAFTYMVSALNSTSTMSFRVERTVEWDYEFFDQNAS